MPMVGKKKYPYTKAGKTAAKKAAKKTGKKVKKVKAALAALSWKMCSFPTARWSAAKPLKPLVRLRCHLFWALHACGRPIPCDLSDVGPR